MPENERERPRNALGAEEEKQGLSFVRFFPAGPSPHQEGLGRAELFK